MSALASGQEQHNMAVPAEFVRYIQLPGDGDQIIRPSSLHYDAVHDEIFVGDPGNNRVVIFSGKGAYKFEFTLNRIMTTPRDIVTDSEGYIYVVGSKPGGRAFQKFDFDGMAMDELPLPENASGEIADIRSIAIAEDGTIIALDRSRGRVHVMADSCFSSFALGVTFPGLQDTLEMVYGDLTISNGEILVPLSSFGTVLRYDISGKYLGRIGFFGALPGTLNFPTSVEVSPENLYLVLDTGRFCVVCYDAEGHFLGEFGGKGYSPGWFINPSLLAVTAKDRVAVGQIYQNKIQICTIPEFIRQGNAPIHSDDSNRVPSRNQVDDLENQRRSSIHSFPSIRLASGNVVPQSLHPYSHLEVSK